MRRNGFVVQLIGTNVSCMGTGIKYFDYININNALAWATAPLECSGWEDSDDIPEIIPSDMAAKYPKYAKVETELYDANFIPQYIDVVPVNKFFTDAELNAMTSLYENAIFENDGFYIFSEETPSASIILRIGGTK